MRALAETASGFDDTLWRQFARLGWLGIEVSEDLGGAGGRFGDFAVVLIELGRRLSSNGLMATAALAAGPLLGAERESAAAQWLAPTARRRRPCGGSCQLAPDRISCGPSATVTVGWYRARRPASLDVAGAEVVILPAIDSRGTILLFAAASTTSGLVWTNAPMLDITRRFADLEASGLELGDAELIAAGSAAEDLTADLFNRAALAVACDAFGVAEQALEMTVGYVKERVQFDRPIGSFQAVKHRCADMFIAVETARAVLDEAIDSYDAAPADAAVAISRAKAYCCDAAAQVTEDAVEMHGGIGFTWEHDIHLYVKRARLDQALFGDSRWHRRRVAALTLG